VSEFCLVANVKLGTSQVG